MYFRTSCMKCVLKIGVFLLVFCDILHCNSELNCGRNITQKYWYLPHSHIFQHVTVMMKKATFDVPWT